MGRASLSGRTGRRTLESSLKTTSAAMATTPGPPSVSTKVSGKTTRWRAMVSTFGLMVVATKETSRLT